MQPIQINVQVNIGLNDGLYSLLAAVINNRQTEAQPAVAEPTKKQPKAKPQAAVDKPADAPKPEAATGKQAAEPQPEPAPVPELVKQEPADKPKEYTEVDVRAAMDRTRKRIEGENYKEKPDSEGYKQWHRALTDWFKTTAAVCGAEKPSALPDSESRARFIACCDAVKVENGKLVEDCPL